MLHDGSGHSFGVYVDEAIGIGFLLQKAALGIVVGYGVDEIEQVIIGELFFHVLWKIVLDEFHGLYIIFSLGEKFVVHKAIGLL